MTLTLVRAAGSPRALGRAQGEAFGDGIAEALAFYGGIAKPGGPPPSLGAFVDAARAGAPEIVAEMEGLAEGSAVSFEEIAWLNCLEEVWDVEACTTMTHGRFLLHAEQWYAGHDQIGVVQAAPENGPAFLSPTCMGFLPAVGLSAAGYGQGIDSLTASDDRVGIPRVAVSRRALGARNLDDAIAAATMDGRAGGYAHTLASVERAVVVETTATGAAVLEHPAGAHTNHYLGDAPTGSRPSRGSRARLERALVLLAESPPRDLDDCARLLADHAGSPESICLHEEGPEASATVFGMACDLATGEMIVSDGRPCSGSWESFSVASLAAGIEGAGRSVDPGNGVVVLPG